MKPETLYWRTDKNSRSFYLKQKLSYNQIENQMCVYTYVRGVIKKITVFFKFFRKRIYLFINNYLILFKVIPTDIIHFRNEHFGIANSSCFDFSFISSILANRIPFIGVFCVGRKEAGTKCGEDGG